MDTLQAGLKGCNGAITQKQADDTSVAVTVAPLTLPALGDQAVGLHAATSGSALGFGFDVVAIRRGDLIAVLVDFNLGGDAPNDGLIQTLARSRPAWDMRRGIGS